jgi:uncharacterized protein (DUF2336 family)
MTGLSNIAEVLTVCVSERSAKDRGRIVREVAALFVDNCHALSPVQVGLFDDILTKLVEQIDGELRAFLAQQLALTENAPAKVLTHLARDENISVAGPVLRLAACLEEEFLVERARTQGQQHLQAISSRARIGARLGDILIDCGDNEVLQTLAGNSGAVFSAAGYSLIIERAKDNADLASALWNRPDISRQHVVMLFERASTAVRAAMERQDGKINPDIAAAIALAKRKLLDKTLDSSAAYASAKARIAALRQGGGLGEPNVLYFAQQGKFEELVVALSSLSRLPLGDIERMLLEENCERLLIVLKAISLSWSTVREILLASRTIPVTAEQLEQTRALYRSLSSDAVAKTLKFHWLREKARGGLSAKAESERA